MVMKKFVAKKLVLSLALLSLQSVQTIEMKENSGVQIEDQGEPFQVVVSGHETSESWDSSDLSKEKINEQIKNLAQGYHSELDKYFENYRAFFEQQDLRLAKLYKYYAALGFNSDLVMDIDEKLYIALSELKKRKNDPELDELFTRNRTDEYKKQVQVIQQENLPADIQILIKEMEELANEYLDQEKEQEERDKQLNVFMEKQFEKDKKLYDLYRTANFSEQVLVDVDETAINYLKEKRADELQGEENLKAHRMRQQEREDSLDEPKTMKAIDDANLEPLSSDQELMQKKIHDTAQLYADKLIELKELKSKRNSTGFELGVQSEQLYNYYQALGFDNKFLASLGDQVYEKLTFLRQMKEFSQRNSNSENIPTEPCYEVFDEEYPESSVQQIREARTEVLPSDKELLKTEMKELAKPYLDLLHVNKAYRQASDALENENYKHIEQMREYYKHAGSDQRVLTGLDDNLIRQIL